MKHFLKRFAPGADRFAGVRTRPATNGSPLLADALAYLECEVTSRMEVSDSLDCVLHGAGWQGYRIQMA